MIEYPMCGRGYKLAWLQENERFFLYCRTLTMYEKEEQQYIDELVNSIYFIPLIVITLLCVSSFYSRERLYRTRKSSTIIDEVN